MGWSQSWFIPQCLQQLGVFSTRFYKKVHPISYSLDKISIEGIGEVTLVKNEVFTATTSSNLTFFSKHLDIRWATVHKFQIKQQDRYTTRNTEGQFVSGYHTATSMLITGVDSYGIVYVYWRKETGHPGAGQTLLYVNGHNPRQVSVILLSLK